MEFTTEVKKATNSIYQKISKAVPEIEWSTHAPYIYEINKLKKEKNAVILAHNYQTPEIYHGISDFSADSLALAVEAAKTKADIIIMCGVHFMAETAKLMSPGKKVLLPDMSAGCSLASSITGEDVRNLKKKYPGVPVVSYVNTSADVKAETDVCCTSANAVKIVNSLGVKKVIFLPDDYLAKYVASNTNVENPKLLIHALGRAGKFAGRGFTLNSEEALSSDFVFVRARNSEFNYTENPSFISGSSGEVIYSYFIDNPQTFPTTVGLYNDGNELLAVAKMSRPLQKDFTKEALIRVKLDF